MIKKNTEEYKEFHDIISDAEIEVVKDLAKPRVNNFFSLLSLLVFQLFLCKIIKMIL